MSIMVNSEYSSVWIHNPKDEPLKYTFLYPNAAFLIFSDSGLSAIIAPHDSLRTIALLDPSYWFRMGLWDGSTAGTLTLETDVFAQSISDSSRQWTEKIQNFVYLHIPDDIDKGITLYQNQFVWNGIQGMDQSGNYYPLDSIPYYNDQDSDVIIQTMFIPKGSHFTIKGFSNLKFPVTLHKGDLFIAYFSYSDIPDTIGYTFSPNPNDSTIIDTGYWDMVVIVTDTTYQIAKANYKGSPPKKILGQTGVHVSKQNSVDILISENPVIVSAHITIPDARSASVKIIDLIGNTVAEANTADWQWNGVSSSSRISLPFFPP